MAIHAYTAGTSSAQARPELPARAYLRVKNESASATIAVAFGATAAAVNTAGCFTLAAGAALDWAYDCPSDAVNVIGSGAGTPVTIQES